MAINHVIAAGEATEAEDEAVPGHYAVSLPDDFPEVQWATAVLDCFHTHVGVSCLDDFTFAVTDARSTVLFEPEDAEAYRLQGAAEFLGVFVPSDSHVRLSPLRGMLTINQARRSMPEARIA